MSVDTTLSTDTLGSLILLFGPQAELDMTRPLTDAERVLVEEGLARHGGDPVAAAGVRVDADTAAVMRSLQVGDRR